MFPLDTMLTRETYACIMTVLLGSTVWGMLVVGNVLGLCPLDGAEVRDGDHRVDDEWAHAHDD